MNKPNLTPAMLLKRYSAGDDRAQLAGLVGVGQALEMLPDTEMDAMRILSVVPGTFDGLAAAELFSRGYEVCMCVRVCACGLPLWQSWRAVCEYMNCTYAPNVANI
jgi:hypothetical protein